MMITSYPLWLNIVLFIVLSQLIILLTYIQIFKKDFGPIKGWDKELWNILLWFSFFIPAGIVALIIYLNKNTKHYYN